jgi:hypothetical protein
LEITFGAGSELVFAISGGIGAMSTSSGAHLHRCPVVSTALGKGLLATAEPDQRF